MKPPRTYRKDTSAAPRGYSSWEAAGLLWLAEAQEQGGARIAQLQDVDLDHIDLLQYDAGPSTNIHADGLGVARDPLERAHAPHRPADDGVPALDAQDVGEAPARRVVDELGDEGVLVERHGGQPFRSGLMRGSGG